MILVIEDDREIRRLLKAVLGRAGHAVDFAATAADGMRAFATLRPDLVILDLGLPDRDGQTLIGEIRAAGDVPILVLSARDDDPNKVAALEGGADDYLTKPFSEAELLARITVALRHARRMAQVPDPIFEVDGLRLDLAARRVSLEGADIRLTPIEYRLLSALVRHAGKVMTHGQLIREVWGRHAPDGTQSLRIHTQHLREKLGDDPLSPRFILTEPGVGYRFRDRP